MLCLLTFYGVPVSYSNANGYWTKDISSYVSRSLFRLIHRTNWPLCLKRTYWDYQNVSMHLLKTSTYGAFTTSAEIWVPLRHNTFCKTVCSQIQVRLLLEELLVVRKCVFFYRISIIPTCIGGLVGCLTLYSTHYRWFPGPVNLLVVEIRLASHQNHSTMLQ